MNACWYGEFNQSFDAVEKHWNSKKNIAKHIGKVGVTSPDAFKGELYLNDVSEHLFNRPWHSSFNFNKGEINRIMREIDKIEKNYSSKKIGAFKSMFFVPDAIANYSPVTRRFYEQVNMAVNYERNNLERYLTSSKTVARHIRNALINEGDMTNSQAKSYQKEMADLEKNILTSGSESELKVYMQRYQDLFDSNGGRVTDKYIELMSMNKSDYQAALEKGTLLKNYGRDLRLAVEESRELLNDMGMVMIQGFDRMENVIKRMANSPILNRMDTSYLKKIKLAKDRIKEGIDQGGYLPHILLDNIVELNAKTRALVESSDTRNLNKNANDILSQIQDMAMLPDQAKSRNDKLNTIWSKNPFYILEQYSKDAIAFNKINFIQDEYIPAIRRFQREDVNPNFIRSMREFLDDTYTISTKGLLERPDWVNGAVRFTMAVETLKSMGLSVTGAIRNGASAAYFFAKSGVLGENGAKQVISRYNSHYQGMLSDIEKEQGFKFQEAGRELIAQGLIPSSVNKSDIVYDPLTSKVTYRDRGVLKTLDPLIDTGVGASLVFHRFTENMTRKWMFRVAWVQSYEMLKGHNVLNPLKHTKPNPDANDAKIKKMATRFALKAVNDFAFEYSPHAKARAIGGTAPKGELGPDGLPKMSAKDYGSALGEITFQFLHYPMSFLNLQSKIAKGSWDAMLSGQTDAVEIKQALRFAGIYGMVSLLSTATNLEFANLLENDTVERIKDLYDYLFLEPEELDGKKYGLINDLTGPVVGDMLYIANALQLYQMPDEEWKKMLLGYIDYYEEGHVPDFLDPPSKIDTKDKRHMWNKLSVSLNKTISSGVAARDGRGIDILRYQLSLYPKSWIKERRERINELTGYEVFEKKRSKRGAPTAEEKLLNLQKQYLKR